MQLHKNLQHYAKIQKKLIIQFEENAWVDGRMERSMEEQTEVQMEIIIQDPSGYHQGSNNRVNELQKKKMQVSLRQQQTLFYEH